MGCRAPQATTLGRKKKSRAYHLFETMVDAHCVRDEGGFTLHWLAAFHWVRDRVIYI